MTRNTLRRIEVAAPVYDKDLKKRIGDMFDLMMRDDEKGKEQDYKRAGLWAIRLYFTTESPREVDRILGEYGVAVFPRTGHDLEEIKADLITENPSFKIELLDAEMVDISSTIIRDAIAEGSDASRWLM